jgi:hypothetical protein
VIETVIGVGPPGTDTVAMVELGAPGAYDDVGAVRGVALGAGCSVGVADSDAGG